MFLNNIEIIENIVANNIIYNFIILHKYENINDIIMNEYTIDIDNLDNTDLSNKKIILINIKCPEADDIYNIICKNNLSFIFQTL